MKISVCLSPPQTSVELEMKSRCSLFTVSQMSDNITHVSKWINCSVFDPPVLIHMSKLTPHEAIIVVPYPPPGPKRPHINVLTNVAPQSIQRGHLSFFWSAHGDYFLPHLVHPYLHPNTLIWCQHILELTLLERHLASSTVPESLPSRRQPW